MKKFAEKIITAISAVIFIFALPSCATPERHEHVFGSKWYFDDSSHYRVCLECNEEVRGEHTFYGNACRVCGYKPEYSASLEYKGVYDGGELLSYTVGGIGSCEDTHIIIPEKFKGLPVTAIEAYAFQSCPKIENLTISGGVRDIGNGAFLSCVNLKSVKMSESVQTLGSNAFASCQNLVSLGISGGVSALPSGVFSGCSSLESVEIPDGVERVSALAFQNCLNLKSVRLGKTVENIDGQAFLNCANLRTLSVSDDNPYYRSENDCIVGNAKNELVLVANNLNVTVPEGVAKISGFAFYICTGVEEIYLPASFAEVEPSAFARCSNLKRVRFGGSAEEWNKIKFNAGNDNLTGAEKIFNATV